MGRKAKIGRPKLPEFVWARQRGEWVKRPYHIWKQALDAKRKARKEREAAKAKAEKELTPKQQEELAFKELLKLAGYK